MATIEEAVRRKVLNEYRLPEWELRAAIRMCYVHPNLLEEDDPRMFAEEHMVAKRYLYDHLEQTLNDLRCSKRPAVGDLKRMMPTSSGVWSLHAPGLRIYGWCPAAGIFVAICSSLELDTKQDKALNNKQQNFVLNFAKDNRLADTILKGDILDLFPR